MKNLLSKSFYKYCVCFFAAMGVEILTTPLRLPAYLFSGIRLYSLMFFVGFFLYFFLTRILIRKFSQLNDIYISLTLVGGEIIIPLIIEIFDPLSAMGCWLDFFIKIIGIILGLVSIRYSNKKVFILLIVIGFIVCAFTAWFDVAIWNQFVRTIRG